MDSFADLKSTSGDIHKNHPDGLTPSGQHGMLFVGDLMPQAAARSQQHALQLGFASKPHIARRVTQCLSEIRFQADTDCGSVSARLVCISSSQHVSRISPSLCRCAGDV